jgi:hypothetical protein
VREPSAGLEPPAASRTKKHFKNIFLTDYPAPSYLGSHDEDRIAALHLGDGCPLRRHGYGYSKEAGHQARQFGAAKWQTKFFSLVCP